VSEVIEAEVVSEAINRLVAENGSPEDDWLAMSFKRLKATLRGLNTWDVDLSDDDVVGVGDVAPE
jgi:hypothetical protein